MILARLVIQMNARGANQLKRLSAKKITRY